MPHPYAFAHTAHRALLFSAGERVANGGLLLNRNPSHVLSIHEVALSAAEAASTAAGIGHSDAQGTRRFQREVEDFAAFTTA
jgi:hypothetical protein